MSTMQKMAKTKEPTLTRAARPENGKSGNPAGGALFWVEATRRSSTIHDASQTASAAG